MGKHIFCCHHQRDKVRRVVADAGCKKLSVFLAHWKSVRVIKYDVRVRHDEIYGESVRVPDFHNDVFGVVYGCILCTLLFEPVKNKRSALFLVMGGRGGFSERS